MILYEGFAVVREEGKTGSLVWSHTRFRSWGNRPSPWWSQKMRTGKEKPGNHAVYLNALSVRVLIVTVNEYLAERDATEMEVYSLARPFGRDQPCSEISSWEKEAYLWLISLTQPTQRSGLTTLHWQHGCACKLLWFNVHWTMPWLW